MAPRTVGLLLLAVGAGCGQEAAPRAQWVVVLDTDLPTPSQSPDRGVPDATVDTLLVEVIAQGGAVVERRDFVVGDARDWPVAFGVVTPGADGVALLRVRLYRAAFAHSDDWGHTSLAPSRALSVDRLLRLQGPDTGVRQARVLLAGDCMGYPADFLADATCVDGARTRASPDQGLDLSGVEEPSRVGTWEYALPVPCSAQAPAGARCIAGGINVLGDDSWKGYIDASAGMAGSPMKMVRLSPFFLDETEFTVGRFRGLVAEGRIHGELPHLRGSTSGWADCTWRGEDDADADPMPLNCLPWATAREACQAVGGDLPSEAQWEHAARGRGEGWPYPWGTRFPSCCTLAAGLPAPESQAECAGKGPELPGSHVDSSLCYGTADVSRDGILDLAGNLGEFTLDSAFAFDAPCWSAQGVPLDPVCRDETTGLRVVRGSNWASGLWLANATLRFFSADTAIRGFRCAYPEASP